MNVSVGSIAEFLEARIAEDEAAAARFHAHWTDAEAPHAELIGDFGVYPSSEYTEIGLGYGRFIAECAAKRNIITLAGQCNDQAEAANGDHETNFQVVMGGMAAGMDLAIKCLAAAYGNHPDYQQEWAI